MSYFIKEGYVENLRPKYFVDNVAATRGVIFQPDVYTFAEWVAGLKSLAHNSMRVTIVDVGCGRAEKLAAMHDRHPHWEYVGVDLGVNLHWCHDTYKWGTWLEADLHAIVELPFGDVVVCADVIEHLVEPLPLVRALARIGSGATIVISTPERDVQHGYDHMGPSPNDCHVREWNASELRAFLTGEGLTVDHVGLTRGSDQSYAMGTLMVICH